MLAYAVVSKKRNVANATYLASPLPVSPNLLELEQRIENQEGSNLVDAARSRSGPS